MRLDRFDLNLLVVLDALLEERNVTRASERLHISQSGTSAALNRLREYFEDELLVRVGRRLTLTPLAQELVTPVREALLQVRASVSRRPSFDPATAQRHFIVGASDYATTVLLASVVRELATVAPGVTLGIAGPPRALAESLDRGSLDLLVMPQQYVEALPHPQSRLFEDTHVCVVWNGHPRVGDGLSFEQYMELGHVAVRFGDARSVSFEDWFLPRYGRARRIECCVDNFATVPLLVVGTERVATLHRRMAEHYAQWLPLRLLPLPFEMPPLVETLVWPRHLHNDPAHRWLRELLSRHGAAVGGRAMAGAGT